MIEHDRAVTDTTDDAALAGDLVREAGRLALRLRRGGIEATRKTSISDLVTEADHAAEELVVSRLAEHRPGDGIVGEEGSRRDGVRRWVIDPVDGTYNFVHGLDWWCSALALAEGDDVVLGAVYHPVGDVLWVGGPGLPTTRDGVALAPIPDRPLAQLSGATYLHPPYFDDPAVGRTFARLAARPATLRMLGSSSMDLAAVADGRLGAWFQHTVPDWDWMPGSALVRGAGGTVDRVTADGLTWSVAGSPSAVADAREALTGDDPAP